MLDITRLDQSSLRDVMESQRNQPANNKLSSVVDNLKLAEPSVQVTLSDEAKRLFKESNGNDVYEPAGTGGTALPPWPPVRPF